MFQGGGQTGERSEDLVSFSILAVYKSRSSSSTSRNIGRLKNLPYTNPKPLIFLLLWSCVSTLSDV